MDEVNSPSHYKHNSHDIECIDAIEASMSFEEFIGYLKGSLIKYTWRYRYKKKPLQDLDKGKWYLNKLMETYGKEAEASKEQESSSSTQEKAYST